MTGFLFGFTSLPWVYDRLAGPLFSVAAQDLVAPVAQGPGSVLSSRPRHDAPRGDHGSAVLAVGVNLRELARRRARRETGVRRSGVGR